MKLTESLTKEGSIEFTGKGYELPKYDRKKVTENTLKNPKWIHFGAGNIFRAFPAKVIDNVLNTGKYDTGVIVAEGFDTEIIDKAYTPFDNLSLLTVLKADGCVDKRVIGSVVDALRVNGEYPEDMERIKGYFENPSLQMISFTITEKGYKNRNLMDVVTMLLYARFTSCKAPLTLASMDNCSHNGDKLKEGVLLSAGGLLEEGKVTKEFVEYVNDPKCISFPWSMIDKITPRPDEGVRGMLINDGFEDAEVIITSKNTYTSAFVNAEETEYLVMEDDFPNGRPPFDLGGVIFTDRKTVDMVEKMKVCTCLNPLHTAMAIYGCLLGYTTIHDEMDDEDIKTLVTRMGYEEGMKVVVNPGIIKPEDFISQVLNKRLPNPFMPDTPQRIACDTSQKLPIRFGETLYAYKERNLGVENLKFIPLVIAGYVRYLMAVDDKGCEFAPSPDPLLDELMAIVKPLKLGNTDEKTVDEVLNIFLRREDIFKVDLYSCGLDGIIKKYLFTMIAGEGAVRKTLHENILS